MPTATGKEITDNSIALFDWKEKFLTTLQEAEVDAILSPVAEIHAISLCLCTRTNTPRNYYFPLN